MDLMSIFSTQPVWTLSFTAHVAAQASAQSARATKDANRTALEVLIRALVRRLQASPSVSEAERAALGITVPDSGATAAASPTTRPVCEVDTSQRLRHTIDFTDEGTPTRKAKPAGVLGAEIWVKIGPTPSTSTMSDVGSGISDVRGFGVLGRLHPKSAIPHPTSGGGETGPWSETATATIGA